MGGLITSTEKAEAEGKNSFSTDRLVREEIHNYSNYKGKSIALGVSSVLGGKTLGQEQDERFINVGDSGVGKTFGIGHTEKHKEGLTTGSINTANLTIHDDAGQRQLTGESAAEAAKNANRGITLEHVKEHNGTTSVSFDADKVTRDITSTAQVMQGFDGTTQEIKHDLRKQADAYRARGDEETAAKLDKLAIGADMLKGGLTPTDSALGTIANTAAPLVSYQIGQYAKAHGSEGSAGHIAAHAALAALTSAANGGSGTDMATSAAITGAAEYSAPLVAKGFYGTSDSSKLTAEQKETISNILGLAAAGTGAAVGNSATAYGASQAAENAVGNNWLSTSQLIDIDKRYHDCGTDELCKQDVIYTAQLMSHSQDTDLTVAKVKCFFGYCDTLDQYIGERVKAADLNIAYKELKKYYPNATEEDLRNAAKYYSDEAVRSFDTSTGRTLIGALDASPAVGLAGSGAREATSAIKQAFKNGAARAVLRNAEVTAAEAASREAVLKVNDTANASATTKMPSDFKAGAGGSWKVIDEISNPKVVKQINNVSCGAACGEMLLKDRNIFAKQTALGLEAKSTNDLARDLNKLGSGRWQGNFVSVDSLEPLNKTGSWAAMMWEKGEKIGHWVVVKGSDKNGKIIIHDPWHGTSYKMTRDEFTNHWTGGAVYEQ